VLRTRWCFVLRDGWGEEILRSHEFLSATDQPTNDKRERATLQDMLLDVRDGGWTIAETPNLKARTQWWTYTFIRGDQLEVARTIQFVRAMDTGGRRSGDGGGLPRGTWIMWAITIAVIIGLFGLCVLLVLSAELRVSPAS
jgi:hypothetical protein